LDLQKDRLILSYQGVKTEKDQGLKHAYWSL